MYESTGFVISSTLFYDTDDRYEKEESVIDCVKRFIKLYREFLHPEFKEAESE